MKPVKRARRPPDPPAELRDHLSRRDAALLLGFGSPFNVRRLEKQGRLHAVRGAMGQAWYPRSQVLALRGAGVTPDARTTETSAGALPVVRRRWSDAELVGYLRGPACSDGRGVQARLQDLRPSKTVVDLVADTGISIARAERVYRFWTAHEGRVSDDEVGSPRTSALRIKGAGPRGAASSGADAAAASAALGDRALPELHDAAAPPGGRERRGRERTERDRLILALRDPNPSVRARAFEKLRNRPGKIRRRSPTASGGAKGGGHEGT